MKFVFGKTLNWSPASHEDPNDPGVLKKVLFEKGQLQSGQVPMVNWSLLRTGKSFVRHFHQDMQEIFLIIQGEAEFSVWPSSTDAADDSQTPIKHRLQPGDAVQVDPGEIHQMTNDTAHDVHYLVFGISAGEHGKTVVVEPS